ncbi:hypothetical protein YC2023_022802 [Brassica napus]
MAVGNPVMQRMLSQRRAALGLPVRDPQESDPTRQQPSNPTDYFDDMESATYSFTATTATSQQYSPDNVQKKKE